MKKQFIRGVYFLKRGAWTVVAGRRVAFKRWVTFSRGGRGDTPMYTDS